MNKLISFFIKQRLFSDLIAVFLVLLGILAVTQLQREVFPNVSFEIISIETILPGGSPEEMEKLVTNPIEQNLKEVDGIKKTQSYSTESRSYVISYLDSDQTNETKAKDEIQSAVDSFIKPDQAEDPKVRVLESKQSPIVEVSMSSDLDDQEMRILAKQLGKNIENVKGVGKVVFKGYRDLEIRIEADARKLAKNLVSLDELNLALKLQNVSIPAGKLDPDSSQKIKSERLVRTVGEFTDLQDIENTVIRGNEYGQVVKVKDVADVFYDLEESSVYNRTNGKPSISLTVLKKPKADAIDVVASVKKVVEEYQSKIKKPFYISYINDLSIFIERRLSILSGNLVVGLFLVMFMLTFFLPFRVALIVSSGILTSFLGCMFLFSIFGYTLNLLSLLGLIIVSGMLVDDAIVVSENIADHMQKGLKPAEAALKGAVEIWPAVAASVLTTVVAFLPMLFMSGIFGKFVKQIPLGVVLALLVSLAEALFILPQHMAYFVKTQDFIKPINPTGFTKVRFRFTEWWENTLTVNYINIVTKIIKRRYLTISIFLGALVSVALLAGSTLKFILFPSDGIEVFFVRMKAPTGTTISEMVKIVKPIEDKVSSLSKIELKDFTTTVGLIQQDPNDPNSKRGVEYAQISLYLTPDTDRERTTAEIRDKLREDIGKPEGLELIWYDQVNPGPPVGKPISLGVQGENYSEILSAVSLLAEEVAKLDGVTDVTNTYVEGKPEIHIKIKEAQAAASGLSSAAIGNTVRAAIGGIISTSITKIDEEIDIRVVLNNENKTANQIITGLKIPNNRGSLIPLTSIANLIEVKGVSILEHLRNDRVVRVQANVDLNKISALAANNKIRETIIDKVKVKFPNLKIDFGGEDEDTQESFKSLGRAFIVAFMAIFLILILTFQNFYQPFLVVLTIPVGIVAVLLTLVVFRMPLSFMASLGVIALAGVIVNNAIILIDFVNQSRASGFTKMDSIIQGARSRLRPIFLTTATTVIGLLPTAHGIGGKDAFVIPIAMSLAYGLLIGSLLTVFIFPAAIAVTDDIQDWINKKLLRKTL